MSESRDKMIFSVKTNCHPDASRYGFFEGPSHIFRREQDGQLDLLMFRFATWGGSFVVDLGYCPPSGYTSRFGKHYPPLKVRVNHLMYWEQLCLGSHPPKTAERRFRYSEDDDMSVYTDIAFTQRFCRYCAPKPNRIGGHISQVMSGQVMSDTPNKSLQATRDGRSAVPLRG